MWELGLVEEVRGLSGRLSRTARGALGYRHVLEALQWDGDMESARQHTIDGTRRFARRQERRFRQDTRVQWVPAGTSASDLV